VLQAGILIGSSFKTSAELPLVLVLTFPLARVIQLIEHVEPHLHGQRRERRSFTVRRSAARTPPSSASSPGRRADVLLTSRTSGFVMVRFFFPFARTFTVPTCFFCNDRSSRRSD